MNIDRVSGGHRATGTLLGGGLASRWLGALVSRLPIGGGGDGAGLLAARRAGSAAVGSLGAALACLLHQDAETPAPPDRP
jgi:hypothetical protein